MKKCILVNCFASSNEMRVEPIREVLEEKGYETTYISSDFHHALKKYVELDNSIVPIRVRPYKKNLSVERLLSHKEFSKKVYEFMCKEKPDMIYIKFPPNTLVKTAYDYKKKYDCKIILDLFDFWPESLPVPERIKKIGKSLLSVWAGYRDKYISCADLVLTECDMYREALKNLPDNTHTIYLTKNDVDYKFHPCEEGKVRLCFVGGINNLINIELIGKVIDSIKKQSFDVSLDIIGDGIRKDDLIRIAEEMGSRVRYHGLIYDEKRKYQIISKCDFGINLVKQDVKIALSIKSIEYFRAGVGLINNVKYDTWNIVKKTESGINTESGDIKIFKVDINAMKQNSRDVYLNLFEPNVFKKKISHFIESIVDA